MKIDVCFFSLQDLRVCKNKEVFYKYLSTVVAILDTLTLRGFWTSLRYIDLG